MTADYYISELDLTNVASRFSVLEKEPRKNHIKAITFTKTCTEIARNMLMFLFEKEFNKKECIHIWRLNFYDKGINDRKELMKTIELEEIKYNESVQLQHKEKSHEDKYSDLQNELIESKHNLNKSEQKCNQLRFELSQLTEKFLNLEKANKLVVSRMNEFEKQFIEKKTEVLFLQHRIDDKQLLINDKQAMIDMLSKKNC